MVLVYWAVAFATSWIDPAIHTIIYFIVEILFLPCFISYLNYKFFLEAGKQLFILGFIFVILVIILGHNLSYIVFSFYIYKNDLSLPEEQYWLSAFSTVVIVIGIISCIIAQILLIIRLKDVIKTKSVRNIN
jgi:hypothetical protein